MIRPGTTEDAQSIAALANLLWPDTNSNELIETVHESLTSSDDEIFVAMNASTMIGFVMVGLRHDYVEASTSSPVGYIEGIFVLPAYRHGGVGRELVQAAETWCGSKGCSEMGSDTEVENTASQKFHKQCGYAIASHIVHFIKPLQKNEKPSDQRRVSRLQS